jgi:hypothetical protein
MGPYQGMGTLALHPHVVLVSHSVRVLTTHTFSQHPVSFASPFTFQGPKGTESSDQGLKPLQSSQNKPFFQWISSDILFTAVES